METQPKIINNSKKQITFRMVHQCFVKCANLVKVPFWLHRLYLLRKYQTCLQILPPTEKQKHLLIMFDNKMLR